MIFIPCLTLDIFIFSGGRGVGGGEGRAKRQRGPASLVYPLAEILSPKHLAISLNVTLDEKWALCFPQLRVKFSSSLLEEDLEEPFVSGSQLQHLPQL